MAIDEDPLKIILQQLKKDFDSDVQGEMIGATISAILSLFPGVGSALQSLLDGKARKNVERRWIQLFSEMMERPEEIKHQIPDASYYGSEESRASSPSLSRNCLLPTVARKSRCLPPRSLTVEALSSKLMTTN